VTPHEGTLTGGLYYDVFTLLALQQAASGRLRVLVLGMGGGTHVRQLLDVVGQRIELSIVGVEIDPGVVELARERLDLREDCRVTVVTDIDARPFVEHCRQEFDLVIVDCYAKQSFLPSHVVSREFFEAIHRLLVPGGQIALNVFGYGGRDPVVEAVVRGLSSVFRDGVVVASVPRSANFVVYARRDSVAALPVAWTLDSNWPASLASLARSMSIPGAAWIARPDPTAAVLRDDDGEMDLIQWQRLASHACALRSSLR
jgi:spermidine synthase